MGLSVLSLSQCESDPSSGFLFWMGDEMGSIPLWLAFLGVMLPAELMFPLGLGFLHGLPVPCSLERGGSCICFWAAVNPAKQMMVPAVPCDFQFDSFLSPFLL